MFKNSNSGKGKKGGSKDRSNGSNPTLPPKDELLKKLSSLINLTSTLPMPKEPPASWAPSDDEEVEKPTSSKKLAAPEASASKKLNDKVHSPSAPVSDKIYATPPLNRLSVRKPGLSCVKKYKLLNNNFYSDENQPSTSRSLQELKSAAESRKKKAVEPTEASERKPTQEKPKAQPERARKFAPYAADLTRQKEIEALARNVKTASSTDLRSIKRTGEALNRSNNKATLNSNVPSGSKSAETQGSTTSVKISRTEAKPKPPSKVAPPVISFEEKSDNKLAQNLADFFGKISTIAFSPDSEEKVIPAAKAFAIEYNIVTFQHGKNLRNIAKQLRSDGNELGSHFAYVESLFWHIKAGRFEDIRCESPYSAFSNLSTLFCTINDRLSYFKSSYDCRYMYGILSLMKHYILTNMLTFLEPYTLPNQVTDYMTTNMLYDQVHCQATTCFFDFQILLSGDFDKISPEIPKDFLPMKYLNFPLVAVNQAADLDLMIAFCRRVYCCYLTHYKCPKLYPYTDDSISALNLTNQPPSNL